MLFDSAICSLLNMSGGVNPDLEKYLMLPSPFHPAPQPMSEHDYHKYAARPISKIPTSQPSKDLNTMSPFLQLRFLNLTINGFFSHSANTFCVSTHPSLSLQSSKSKFHSSFASTSFISW